MNRRSFLKTAALTGVASAFSARSWSQVAGANSSIRVAVVGVNGKGKSHIDGYRQLPGVSVAALCDVDTAVLAQVTPRARAKGHPAENFTDVRRLLERADIDAISIATPNHWHSLLAIWAVQAGKDVYVEKPISHNIWEGRQLVRASQKYLRVVQSGTQARSSLALIEAVAWVRDGQLGKILSAHGVCYKPRESIGLTSGPQPIPATVDYDLWCGPAPLTPPRRHRFHYDWHWFWATGNGELGNQGCHQLDMARWFLGEETAPPRVLSVGGRLGYIDDGQTPNTLVSFYDYARAPLIFEVRGLPAGLGRKEMDRFHATAGIDLDPFRGSSVGVVIRCEGGTVTVADAATVRAYDRDGKPLRSFQGDSSHFANFIDVVRSRKTADLRGPILEAHVSASLSHLGNISHRLGHRVGPEEIKSQLKQNAPMADAFGRMAEHLARNGVNLEKTPATLGMPLAFDAQAESIPGNPPAAPLLTRTYRSPYVVPNLA